MHETMSENVNNASVNNTNPVPLLPLPILHTGHTGQGRNHLYKEFRSCEVRKHQIEHDKVLLTVELETVSARMADIEAALILIPSAKNIEIVPRRMVS